MMGRPGIHAAPNLLRRNGDMSRQPGSRYIRNTPHSGRLPRQNYSRVKSFEEKNHPACRLTSFPFDLCPQDAE
jgi:hypothetical protein